MRRRMILSFVACSPFLPTQDEVRADRGEGRRRKQRSWRSLAAVRRRAKWYLNAFRRHKILDLCPRQLPMGHGKVGGSIGVACRDQLNKLIMLVCCHGLGLCQVGLAG